MQSEVKTARPNDMHSSRQGGGDGPLDLVIVPGLRFYDQGLHELKGVPGNRHFFRVKR